MLGGVAKAARVPVARVDFGARPVGEMRPRECFSALFMLKQQLSGFRVATPRFDFAAVTYLHKLGFDLGRRLPELFPRGELGAALDLADALLPVQLMRAGQGVFDALDKRLDEVFTRRRVQRRLSRGDAEEILSLAPEPDLIQAMPRLFAADLRGAVGEDARHPRVVLLFDTHEAFFGEAIADPDALVHAGYLMRDEWLRGLLGHLPLEAGVVVVVAGRTRPPWGGAPVAAIPDAFVDAWPVGHLAIPEALAYLEKAGVEGEQLRQVLADHAAVGPGEVHPYFRHLVVTGGQPSEREFLGQLAEALPGMRGAGPTTRAAVARFQQTGQIHASGGDTNGALMRILSAGWAIPASRADRRRAVVTRLTRVTPWRRVSGGRGVRGCGDGLLRGRGLPRPGT